MKPEPQVGSELEKRLDVSYHLPRLRLLAIAVAIAAVAGLLAWPISAATRRGAVSSGAVSNHHKLLESHCERCHDGAFGAVRDVRCAACHPVQQHASAVPAIVAAHPELGAHCTSCHKEHHGDRNLVPSDSPLCTRCHARMAELLPSTTETGISDFAHHPEFAVLAWSGTPPVLARTRLDQPGVRGVTHLKFSHEEHLGELDANGMPALACASCHAPAADGKNLEPISFARHCERCHHIEFDDRLPGAFLPHGETAVIDAITGQVAKLHVEQLHGSEAQTRDLVAKESADDETGMFTPGGACFRCHDVERVAPAPGQTSHYNVMRSNMSGSRMPAARFAHGAHRLVACEGCHAGVRESASAGDILLPHIARCRECHADPGTPGKVDSPCLQCHVYHAHAR